MQSSGRISYQLIATTLGAILLLILGHTTGHSDEEGLMMYLSFEERKGVVATDISGNENHGDINDTKWVDGKYDSALEFSGGPESYIRVKKSDSLVPTDQLTLEAWVFPTTIGGNKNIISNTEGSGHTMRFEGAELKAYIHVGGDYATPVGGANITANQWYHTAATYDGTLARVYLNGEIVGEVERKGKITESTQDIFIGSETDGNQPNVTYMFFGIIDEVRIWHVARTPDQIKAGMEKLTLPVDPRGNLATSWGQIKYSGNFHLNLP